MGMFEVHAPTAKFTGIGHRIGGQIVDGRRVQCVEYKTNRPEYWQGKAKVFNPFDATGAPNEPKSQLELTVETGEPDSNGETERRLFIKNKRQIEALKAALRKARARRGVVIGGSIWMTQTGTEASAEGGNDAKTWAIEYEPPAPGALAEEISDVVHLYGGGTWSRSAAAPRQVPVAVTAPSASGPASDALQDATREAVSRVERAHASSPVLNRQAAQDDEPPF